MIINRFSNQKYINAESRYFSTSTDCLEYEPIPTVGDFTISIFIKIYNLPTVEIQPYISQFQLPIPSLNEFNGWYIRKAADGIRFVVGENFNVSRATLDISESFERYNHLVGVFKSNDYIETYLNGRLVERISTTLASVPISNFKLQLGGSISLTPEYTSSSEIANASIFNKVLTQDEITYLHRYNGIIPSTAHENVLFYAPLDYKSFAKKSYLDVNSISIPVSINQVGHGLSIGNCIYDNSGNWELADGTIAIQYSNPPTVVSNVVDADNFDYVQEGIATIIGHGFILGNNLYCQSNGSLDYIETGNFIGKVIDLDTIHIASAIRQGVTTAHSQFNYAKTNPIEELNGQVFGKSDNDLGIPTYSTQTSFINLYDGTLFEPTTLGLENKSGFPIIQQQLRMNNLSSVDKNITPDLTLPNLTDDFSYLIGFSLPAEDITVTPPSYGRFLTLKNTVSGYSLEIRYNYATKELEFVAGLNELFIYTIEREKIASVRLSVVVTRENSNIVFYFNGYPITSTNTPLDLTGCDIIKIGN